MRHDGHEELAPVGCALPDRRWHPRIRVDVAREDGAQRARGLGVELVLDDGQPDVPDDVDELARHVVADVGRHPLAVLAQEPDPHRVRAEGGGHAAKEVPEERSQIERRRQRAADGQQGFRLAQLGLGLAGEIRVLEREADLGRDALE